MRRAAVLSLPATALFAAALTACGGGSTSGSASGAGAHPAVDAGFLTRVNAVCARDEPRAATPSPSPSASLPPAALRRLGATLRKRVAARSALPQQLVAVGAPAQGQAEWRDFRALATRANDLTMLEASAAAAGDVARYRETRRQLAALQPRLEQAERRAGFAAGSPCDRLL